MDRDSLIRFYFDLNMPYDDIVSSLAQQGISISKRQLKRFLRVSDLYRRRYDNIEEVIDFIIDQLQGSGRMHGYRWMYTKCVRRGIRVRKEDVRILLALLDPVSSQARQRRRLSRRLYFSEGPNFIWHVDSYDKLKPYGICINGCIDGFSRRIIWLKASYTNSNSKVIGGFFVEAIERFGGCPRLVRADMGTENVTIKDIQMYLRRNNEDDRAGNASYITGTSTANQRIESWWGQMRKAGVEHWIQLFGELKDEGLFSGDFLDKALVQFCFMAIIQEELDQISDVWNAHRIRPSRNTNVPSGIPNVMHLAPHLWNTEDLLVPVCEDELVTCKECCQFLTSVTCDGDVFDLCSLFLEDSRLAFPVTESQALDLYLSLKDWVHAQLQDP
ncbi:uncharacterized protein LOC125806138 [Astyanax mexicanus]|nr:uncharacterized protein LOC125782461 [Astyanax mexicanus]XP_049333639.1 uncharacterized protein LOC125801254 [Astyanax mexicanus]XP_049333640.1 uncharacterized protein LOC125801255 [Astyanax mexicanus]XP_049335633.1 uncharacterized protein LOC125802256 [Astyanax mexicanus]XP_049342033.1 uncharacterized protein LOC125806138 [Astyanax mexicanus]